MVHHFFPLSDAAVSDMLAFGSERSLCAPATHMAAHSSTPFFKPWETDLLPSLLEHPRATSALHG